MACWEVTIVGDAVLGSPETVDAHPEAIRATANIGITKRIEFFIADLTLKRNGVMMKV